MRLNEIFNSIDGEVNSFGQGCFSTFIRLQGCNLKCKYCDTKRAQNKKLGYSKSNADLAALLQKGGYKKLTITGGEPLLQKDGLQKFFDLLPDDYKIVIETNGTISPDELLYQASFVVDYKLPSSGMQKKMNPEVFLNLQSTDFVKFVILDENDFSEAFKFIEENWDEESVYIPQFAFSPIHGELDPIVLKQWIQDSGLPQRFTTSLNIQLHKILQMP